MLYNEKSQNKWEQCYRIVINIICRAEIYKYPNNEEYIKRFHNTYAANAYNLIISSTLDAIILDLCNIWDNQGDYSVPKIIKELSTIEVEHYKRKQIQLAERDEAKVYKNKENNKSQDFVENLKKRILTYPESQQFKRLRNYRTKHLAHKLEKTNIEKKANALIDSPLYNDVFECLDLTIDLLEEIYTIINPGKFYGIKGIQPQAHKISEEFWLMIQPNSPVPASTSRAG